MHFRVTLHFYLGAELDDALRRDQEVVRRADCIAGQEGIDPLLPSREVGPQRGNGGFSSQEERAAGRIAAEGILMRGERSENVWLLGKAEMEFDVLEAG
jgi:hypothetical protein